MNSADGITAFAVGSVDADILKNLDMLVVPHEPGSALVNNETTKALIREWIRAGGGVMTTHDVVGYRSHQPLLPKTLDNPKNDQGTVQGFWKKDFDDSGWTNTPVPVLDYSFEGVRWFRRKLQIPEFKGSRYVMRFSGVKEEVRVFVNGKEA